MRRVPQSQLLPSAAVHWLGLPSPGPIKGGRRAPELRNTPLASRPLPCPNQPGAHASPRGSLPPLASQPPPPVPARAPRARGPSRPRPSHRATADSAPSLARLRSPFLSLRSRRPRPAPRSASATTTTTSLPPSSRPQSTSPSHCSQSSPPSSHCSSRQQRRSKVVSCQGCRRRKSKCDHSRPGCTQCRIVGIECVYQADAQAAPMGKGQGCVTFLLCSCQTLSRQTAPMRFPT